MADEEFSAFYAATYQRLLGQLVLLSGDRAEAEDALQEAFARAAVRWHRLRTYQAPEAWVRRVALNLTRMAARRLRRRTAALLRLGSPPAAAELSAETVDLLVALRALPVAQRQVLVLHHLVGLPVAEVAASCACRPAANIGQLAKIRAVAGISAGSVGVGGSGRRAGGPGRSLLDIGGPPGGDSAG
jgi:RNA polymerase sigma-70 factor, ECF subfamily